MRRAPADTRRPSATVTADGTAHSAENSSEPHGVTMLSLIGTWTGGSMLWTSYTTLQNGGRLSCGNIGCSDRYHHCRRDAESI